MLGLLIDPRLCHTWRNASSISEAQHIRCVLGSEGASADQVAGLLSAIHPYIYFTFTVTPRSNGDSKPSRHRPGGGGGGLMV